MKDHGFSAVSLLFASDGRPSPDAVKAFAHATQRFSVSYDPLSEAPIPGEPGDVWLELNIAGLSFDLRGLAPGRGCALPDAEHRYGLAADFSPSDYAAITLAPGPHLAGGGAMFPVIRSLAWVGALLATLPHVAAVAWHPAQCYSEPSFFHSSVIRWIEGGAFPGLGLTSLAATCEGGLRSVGLAIFTGQELEVLPELISDRAEGAKIALRLLHWMIENGRITDSQLLTGPSGESLLIEPVGSGEIVRVLRNRR